MSLRSRITILVASAVALAFVVAALLAWTMIRSVMMTQLDDTLLGRVPDAGEIQSVSEELPSGAMARDRMLRFNSLTQDDQVAVQFIGPDGSIDRQLAPRSLSLETPEVQDLPAPTSEEPRLDTVAIDGVSYRVLTTAVGGTGSLMRLFQPLTALEQTLSAVAWALTGIALVGVTVAAGLGWLVARTAVRPVQRLVAASEAVTATGNLSRRVPVRAGARDELARLSTSFNSMLSALESSRTQQRELLENASHELRTPLTVLRNDFGLLARLERTETGNGGDREQLIQDLDSQVTALADEVDQIVTLARGDTTAEPPVSVPLRELLEQAAKRVRRLNPQVTVHVDAPLDQAVVFPNALERAVTNLARNAVQVSPDGATVTIALKVTPETCSIEVCDEGPGLADLEIPLLFQRFFRGTGSRERHGSGLGLAIVEQAAQLHGGRVVTGNRPGGGARFTFSWPTAHLRSSTLRSPLASS
ncbi:HAMP domain-containing sensor histidine kinase [Nesterenkonia sp. DZ6]|uniref:HAMP domain-containing sensor histidine kinase n=1 Tax=Nesterenkonia sp. DZ6 TaxID=2901229 RepID=UPI001F4C5E6C|nr:HAMP domain-containing sensor histidine kinase [Nesterenkonia sp. DZ6]MCH8560757.1 HAMP domain-containing histidine kinase [Nesterenkonia sp. DZ6]